MPAIIKKYTLELVQESSKKYSVDKQITNPFTALDIFKEVFRLDRQAEEVLALICLDTKNKVIGAFEVSRGTLNSSTAHPREIFKRALSMNSARIMLAHNHPSGEVEPSRADEAMTKRIIEGGQLLGIELLDHMIIGGGNDESFSFRAETSLFD